MQLRKVTHTLKGVRATDGAGVSLMRVLGANTTDTYDQGGHLNLSGAEKLSKYFGNILVQELKLESHHGEKDYQQVWDTLCAQYEQIRQTQERLLAENGKLTGFTGLD